MMLLLLLRVVAATTTTVKAHTMPTSTATMAIKNTKNRVNHYANERILAKTAPRKWSLCVCVCVQCYTAVKHFYLMLSHKTLKPQTNNPKTRLQGARSPV
uniref:Putative secreted protein n=1 Tax=Anopheles darlingi TaxID=43151 RepID=A0A2M4DB41_ANODA